MSAVETKDEGTREDAPDAEENGQVLLFNRKFEGEKITDYRINFGGNVELGDKAVIDALTLNSEVTLIVKGRVTSRGHKMKTAKDSKGSAVSSSTVVIESVTLDEA